MSHGKGDFEPFAQGDSDANDGDWLWLAEMDEPIPLDLPETEQVQRLFRARIIEANESFARGFGRPLEEILGTCRLEDLFPGSSQRFADLLLALVRSGYRLENYETSDPSGSGEPRIFLNTFVGSVQRGQIFRVWGSSREVTQSRRLQRQIQLQREAIESSNDGFVIADARQPDLPLVYANDRFLRLTGYELDEVLGRNCRFLQGPDTDPMVTWAIRKALKEGSRFQGEILNYRKDGPAFWNFLRISPVRDKYFTLTHFVGLMTDISSQKQAQLAADRHRDELAHVSRAATLVEIGAALAHELSQPMAAILRNAQAAQRFLDRQSPDLEAIRAILTDIIRDDRRAGDVLVRIRDHLSGDPGDFRPLSINQVIEDSLKLLHSDLIMKRMTVRLDLAADLPMTLGDPIQLQQVILNLILNAEDAMQASVVERPEIAISTGRVDLEIHVHVADKGPGIPAEQIEKIFDPFHTSKKGGMGVGLSISRRIVESHGGNAWAENVADGAKISFTLPVVEAVEHDDG